MAIKKKKGPKKRQASLSGLKRKAWDAMSRVKRQLFADYRGMVSCVTCDREHHWKELDSGHWIPKSRGLAVYFDWFNFWPQCTYCNRFLHGNLTKYTIWMCDTLGRDEVDRLDSLSRTQRKITRADYEEMIAFFKKCEEELT